MKPRFGLTMLAWMSLALGSTQAAAQNIYKWTDAEGRVHFSDQPPPDAGQAEVVGKVPSRAQRATPSSPTPAPAPEREQIPDYSPGSPAAEARDRRQREQDDAEAARHRAADSKASVKRDADAARLTDQQVIDRCNSRRETYCDEGAAEIRRRDLEHDWHQYDVERNRAARPLPGAPNYRPDSGWRKPPPAPPSEPRPPPAETLYDKNTKKNRDTKQR